MGGTTIIQGLLSLRSEVDDFAILGKEVFNLHGDRKVRPIQAFVHFVTPSGMSR
jgi:hypothetical protein